MTEANSLPVVDGPDGELGEDRQIRKRPGRGQGHFQLSVYRVPWSIGRRFRLAVPRLDDKVFAVGDFFQEHICRFQPCARHQDAPADIGPFDPTSESLPEPLAAGAQFASQWIAGIGKPQ